MESSHSTTFAGIERGKWPVLRWSLCQEHSITTHWVGSLLGLTLCRSACVNAAFRNMSAGSIRIMSIGIYVLVFVMTCTLHTPALVSIHRFRLCLLRGTATTVTPPPSQWSPSQPPTPWPLSLLLLVWLSLLPVSLYWHVSFGGVTPSEGVCLCVHMHGWVGGGLDAWQRCVLIIAVCIYVQVCMYSIHAIVEH